MKEIGIVFGCIDFIQNHQGDYIFLEVNEQGQFLWLEKNAPELSLLDNFCKFLIFGDHFASLKQPWERIVPHKLLPQAELDLHIAKDVAEHVVDIRARFKPVG